MRQISNCLSDNIASQSWNYCWRATPSCQGLGPISSSRRRLPTQSRRRAFRHGPATCWTNGRGSPRIRLQATSPGPFFHSAPCKPPGRSGSILPDTQADLLLLVERAASDPRWRVREAAAIALQRIGLSDFSALEGILKQWSSEASLLEWRAIIAALAEPRLLNHDDRARTALDFGARAVRALESVPPADRRKDDFLALRKCLAYGLSVFAAALPSEGFALLTSLARSKDAAVVWVVGENLKKQRLAGSHADAVNAVRQLLD
jgi:hypothetical protein